jgi:uncharacterized membrane protein YgaE (UPF0421/DUF939 family)
LKQFLLATQKQNPRLQANCIVIQQLSIDYSTGPSTYFSLLIGAIVGGTVSWWIFKRQKMTSEKQDIAIKRIETLNENHERLLKRMEQIEQNHQKTLNAIYELNKKMDRAGDGDPLTTDK